MNELTSFFIKKKFLNRTNLIVTLTISSLFLLCGFSDKIVNFLSPSYFEPIKVKVSNINEDIFCEIADKEAIISDDAKITIAYENKVFSVSAQGEMNNYLKNILTELINKYVISTQSFNNDFEIIFNDEDLDKPINLKLIISITAIYLLMVVYSSQIINEIVMEKKSNYIELIGTMIPIKKLFKIKIKAAVVSIILQILIIITSGFIVILMRNSYDKGKGLFHFLYRINGLPKKYESFKQFLNIGKITFESVNTIIVTILMFTLGLILMQTIMVLIGSILLNIEEANTIQLASYIFFLVLHLIAKFLIDYYSINQGWGYYISYIPIFSMLLTPIRMLSRNYHYEEILLTIVIAILSNILVYFLAEKVYIKKLYYKRSKKK